MAAQPEFLGLLERVLGAQEGLGGLLVQAAEEQQCTSPGDNFLSDVTVAEVHGRLGGGEPYFGRVFVKRPPSSATSRALGAEAGFANEPLAYGLIGDVSVCARCLHATSDVILLQDLVAQGYRMQARPRGLPPDALPSVVQALAKFHGASFVRLRADGAFRGAAARLLPMGLAVSNNGTLESGLRRMQRLAGAGDGEALGRLLAGATKLLRALRRPAPNTEVLAHGDFWLNNLMLDETHSQTEPVKIVDLQACALASPAVDVWTLLYTSVDPPTLRDLADSAVDLYCDSFLGELRSAGVPKDAAPATSALKQVHRLVVVEDIMAREQYGLLAAALYLPALFIRSPRDEVLRAGSLESVLDPDQLRSRVCDLLTVSRQRGVLDRV